METRDILGREEYDIQPVIDPNLRVLVTGGMGSIGTALAPYGFYMTDIIGMGDQYLDITNEEQVRYVLGKYKPNVIINLAGAKHAPEGEVNVEETIRINTLGVSNIIKYAPEGCKIIQASTCKSCNPETVYGATKLLSERMVLNAGGSVVRYYNVVETSGNVFEIWRKAYIKGNLLKVVAKCKRYFISLNEAKGLTLAAINLPAGRYSIDTFEPIDMMSIANRCYPDAQFKVIEPRRGDRVEELLHATHEYKGAKYFDDSVVTIHNRFDA